MKEWNHAAALHEISPEAMSAKARTEPSRQRSLLHKCGVLFTPSAGAYSWARAESARTAELSARLLLG